MTPEHFQRQINRLIETFGKAAYGQERLRLLWLEVEKLDDAWLTRVVDEFVGSLRHPPLLPEFREKASIERERQWQEEKRLNRAECKAAMASIYQHEDIKAICESIRRRSAGAMNDEDFGAFLKTIGGDK